MAKKNVVCVTRVPPAPPVPVPSPSGRRSPGIRARRPDILVRTRIARARQGARAGPPPPRRIEPTNYLRKKEKKRIDKNRAMIERARRVRIWLLRAFFPLPGRVAAARGRAGAPGRLPGRDAFAPLQVPQVPRVELLDLGQEGLAGQAQARGGRRGASGANLSHRARGHAPRPAPLTAWPPAADRRRAPRGPRCRPAASMQVLLHQASRAPASPFGGARGAARPSRSHPLRPARAPCAPR